MPISGSVPTKRWGVAGRALRRGRAARIVRSRRRSRAACTLRWPPFAVFAALTLWVAAGLPHGRKPFAVDLSLSASTLAESLSKVPHYRTTAVLFLCAAIAVGWRRPLAALLLTMLVGAGWELAESTAIGHTARLADLAPDLLAALGCLAVLLLARWGSVRVPRRHPGQAGRADDRPEPAA